MRKTFAFILVVLGFAVQAVSYIWLAAPWEFHNSPMVSTEPRIEFAPLFFIGGIALVFFSAVVYEIYPSRKRQ